MAKNRASGKINHVAALKLNFAELILSWDLPLAFNMMISLKTRRSATFIILTMVRTRRFLSFCCRNRRSSSHSSRSRSSSSSSSSSTSSSS